MTDQIFLRCLGLGVAATLVLAGCGGGEDPNKNPGKSGDTDFPSGTGQAPQAVAAYPAGPFGYSKGSIIPNFKFVGYVNAQVNNQTMQAIQFADFYNPNGRTPGWVPAEGQIDDTVFPEGSQYGAGTKKPTVLAFDGGAVWCGPCNQEAKTDLPPLHAKYKPCGGEFLLQLFDGPTPGIPAEPKHLFSWTKKYAEDFPAVIDPSSKMMATFAADAFPGNLLIDLTTMQIVEVVAGVPPAAYWTKFEKLLPNPSCPAGQ